jgi:hypothetical protein
VGLLVVGLDGVGLAVVSVDGASPQPGINKAKHPRIARKAKDLTIFDSFCRNKAQDSKVGIVSTRLFREDYTPFFN